MIKLKNLFIYLFNIGVDETLSETKTKRVRITNILAVATIILVTPYYFLFKVIDADFLKILIPFVVLYQISILLLNKLGYTNLSRFIAPNMNALIIFTYSVSLGPETRFFLFYFPALSGGFLYYENKERLFLFFQLIFDIILIVLDLFFKVNIFPHVNLSPDLAVFSSYFLMFFAFVLFVVCLLTLELETTIFKNKLKKNNKLLIKSENKYRTLTNNIPDAIWTIDSSGAIIYISPNVERIIGYSSDEIYNDPGLWEKMIHREDVDRVMKVFSLMFEKRKEYELEYRVVRKNGEFIWAKARSTTTYFIGDVLYADGVISDITPDKKVEQDLIKAKQDAETANSAKSDFLARMSHEIRTPINAVIGLTHLAISTELTAKQRDYLTKIQDSSRSLLGIINEVLDFSKIEAEKMTIEKIKFNLRSVMEHLSNTVNLKAVDKDLEIIFSIDERIPDILRGDPLRLGQILINLVDNAIKFTEKGIIEVSTKIIEETDGNIIISFSVRDEGIGMSDEQVANVFDSFFQGDDSITRNYGGTGLGLTISKKLVELMDGRLNVESSPGKGTEFVFEIPLGKIHEKEQEEIRLLKKVSLQGSRVLLVEDNLINQQVISELVEQIGLDYDLAVDGMDGYKKACNNSYDLILMDIQMPVMDGLKATEKIRGSGLSDIPIIAMSAHVLPTDKKKSLNAGMNGYITKPIDPEELNRILLKFIQPVKKNIIDIEVPIKKNIDGINIVLPEIDGIDTSLGLKGVNGSKKLYVKLIREYSKLYKDSLNIINDQISNRQIDAAKNLAHSIKGASNMLGMNNIANIYSSVEEELIKGNIEKALEHLSLNRDKFSMLIGDIEKHFFNNDSKTLKKKIKRDNTLNISELSKMTYKLIDYCNESNSDALLIAEQLQAELSETVFSDNITRIIELIGDVEFKEAVLSAKVFLNKIEV